MLGVAEPVCEENAQCRAAADIKHFQPGPNATGMCRCSGTTTHVYLLANLEVVDVVQVPSVAPGRYVLQWRWDAEETDQVWANCADVIVEA